MFWEEQARDKYEINAMENWRRICCYCKQMALSCFFKVEIATKDGKTKCDSL
jgi:hypothetical protein